MTYWLVALGMSVGVLAAAVGLGIINALAPTSPPPRFTLPEYLKGWRDG